MAKPTTYATPICLFLSLVAAVGIVIGFVQQNPLWAIILLIPAVGYEVYRTEGASTKLASWGLLILLIAELICVVFGVHYDLATFMEQDSAYIAGTVVPLGDITVVFPMVMAALAVVLFVRTAGIYTKWLAVIIFASMVSTVYLISPTGFGDLIRSAIRSVLWYF
ncbi:MAG: hypothetical protein WC451_04455 [Patescibacteria group bacterium]